MCIKQTVLLDQYQFNKKDHINVEILYYNEFFLKFSFNYILSIKIYSICKGHPKSYERTLTDYKLIS